MSEADEAGNRPPRGYSWPPFEAGHEVSLRHGANSPRRVGPLAAQYAEELLASEDTPEYLRAPRYRAAVMAYCRAAAACFLLLSYLDEQGDIAAMLTDTTVTDESELRTYGRDGGATTDDGDGDGGGSATRAPGNGSKRRTARRTTSQHVASAFAELYRWEGRLAKASAMLGLDPASHARIGKDVTGARAFDLAAEIARVSREDAARLSREGAPG
jgi:hypothetical protein